MPKRINSRRTSPFVSNIRDAFPGTSYCAAQFILHDSLVKGKKKQTQFDLYSTHLRAVKRVQPFSQRATTRRILPCQSRGHEREVIVIRKYTNASQFPQKKFPLCGPSQIRAARSLPFALENFPSPSSLCTWIPYVFPSTAPARRLIPFLRLVNLRESVKRISGLRDPAGRECSGEASEKCGQIVSPRRARIVAKRLSR